MALWLCRGPGHSLAFALDWPLSRPWRRLWPSQSHRFRFWKRLRSRVTHEEKLLAVLDAGRGDVYAGEYEVNDSGASLVREVVLARSELMGSASGWTVVTADPSLASAARDSGLRSEQIDLPGSDVILRLGWKQILAGELVSPSELDANYIRRSADIFSKKS